MKIKVNFFAYYFLAMMVMFRPLSFIVLALENDYAMTSQLVHILFIAVYISVPMIFFFCFRTLTWDICILFLVQVAGIALTNFIFPQNMVYLKECYISILYGFITYWIVRTCKINLDTFQNILISAARALLVFIFVVLGAVYHFQLRSLYMTFSDGLSIVCAVLLYSGIVLHNKTDKYFGLAALLSILVWGGRGAFLSLCILIMLFILFQGNNSKKKVVFFVVIIAGLTTVMCFGDVVAASISSLIGESSSRTINAILSGNFLVDNSRMRIYECLVRGIKENPVMGLGLCGDRYLLPMFFNGKDATYAHNVFLEITVDYGLISGSIINLVLLRMIIFGFLLNKKITYEHKCFISVFFVVSFVQLLTSRSYLTEKTFFLFIGLVANCWISDKKRKTGKGKGRLGDSYNEWFEIG